MTSELDSMQRWDGLDLVLELGRLGPRGDGLVSRGGGVIEVGGVVGARCGG